MVGTTRQTVVVFEVQGQGYGLPLADVREVLPAVAVVPLPRAPAVIEGIINCRGQVVPVFDLRRRFGLRPRALDPAEHLVIAWDGRRTVALRADRVTSIESFEPQDVTELDEILKGSEHVAGVVRRPEGLLLVHDLRAFLTQAEAASLDEALEAAPSEV